MDANIPSPDEVKAALEPLGYAQMKELSRRSGVAFTTLWKAKTGETKDPGVSKVRAFWPHIGAVRAWAPAAPVAAAANDHADAAAEPRSDHDRRSGIEHFGTVNSDRINDNRSGADRRTER